MEYNYFEGIVQNPEEHKKALELIRKYRPFDDIFARYLFKYCPEVLENILRIITGNEELKVLYSSAQEEIPALCRDKTVIFDVFAICSDQRRYNVEIQRVVKNSIVKRSRLHRNRVDFHSLNKGEDVENMPYITIIFICEEDPFGGGYPIYDSVHSIRPMGIEVDDGVKIIYINGQNNDDTPLGRLMHNFGCADPDDMYLGFMKNAVKKCKTSRKVIYQMCELIENFEREIVTATELRVREETKMDILFSLVRQNLISIADAAKQLSISKEEFELKYRQS